MSTLVAVDLGVTQTKVCMAGRAGKFVSLVAPVPAATLRMPGTEGIEIVYEGTHYYIDERAAHDADAANYPVHVQALDTADDVRFCAALGMLSSRGMPDGLHVVTGLPVHEYSRLKDAMAEHFTRQWDFTLNGREYRVPVTNVSVVPQGAGAYYAAILGADGAVVNEDRARKKVLVLDIGGRTTNALTFERARFRARTSFTVFRGMVHVYNVLRRFLQREQGISVTLYEAGEVLRNGSLKIGDTLIPLESAIREAADPVWQDILDQIELELPGWPTYNEVILAGGGADFFAARIRAFFQGVPVTVLEKAEYANVRGYESFALLQQQSRSTPVSSGS